jgi:1-deoxy-D-xylulose-5-phosphate reductoisomerase
MKKKIAILGSTGSIGRQALEVIESNPDLLQAEILVANNNSDLLIEQALKYQPNTVVIGNETHYQKVSDALSKYDIKVFAGEDSVNQIVESTEIDIVLASIVGFAGLKSTLRAIEAKKNIALANKETLVVAGDIVTSAAKKNGVNILPVDSEHSAIFQCLTGEMFNKIEKIYLTASGGPFRGKDKKYLEKVTKHNALKHPNWNMGEKITIDSATLINKGLEVIEAKWLFDIEPEQIEVVVHPQSIIHSMVQFTDGSIKAQLGLPDMKLPIQYALTYPLRIKTEFERFSFSNYSNFTFEKPDIETFSGLKLAYQIIKQGGNLPCVFNAANEEAVYAFLNDKIRFTQIPETIEKSINEINFISQPALDDYIETDKLTRIKAKEIINKIKI